MKVQWQVRLNEGGYFSQRKFRGRRLKSINLDGVPQQPKDPIHQVDASAGTPDRIITDITNREGAALECDSNFKLQQWKIMTLLHIPEFKLIWRDHSFEIGCGVTVVLTLPVLQTRISELDLYAYARAPSDVGQYIERMIEDCAWKAALAGAVIGIVMANFASALAGFVGAFTDCIETKTADTIKCLIPGLMLMTEVMQGHDWTDV